ncbi:asparaginase [Hydrogenophaga soli]
MKQRRLLVLGTGGTIAGRSTVAGDNVGYRAGEVSVDDLLTPLQAHLSLLDGWTVEAVQVAQLDSKDMDETTWMALAHAVHTAVTDPTVGAVVITHGTDTLEETAYFLSRVVPADKPVVLTCAMRPASALCPDGPQNLLDALAVAVSDEAQGVWVVASGRIHAPDRVTKVHPYQVDAFSSGEAGVVGWVEEAQVRWSGDQPRVSRTCVPLAKLDPPWPRVEVVFSHGGASASMLASLVDAAPTGAADAVQGLVVAGTGNGTIHQAWMPGLTRAMVRGVTVWRTTRCTAGSVVEGAGAAIPAVALPPFKARLELVLHLAQQRP